IQMANSIQYPEVATAIKKILKGRKLSLAELAQKTGIPLSTLKKNLSGSDCSFSRIVEICGALDVGIEDLLTTMQGQAAQDVEFSKQQAEAFLADRELFHVFWLLVYERRRDEDIVETLR